MLKVISNFVETNAKWKKVEALIWLQNTVILYGFEVALGHKNDWLNL